ncbi:MAG TPA: tryptophan synthase subunit alpha [Anaerolineae bacterium]|nr:tryptophan synthase subunit alpha [Anaerolineae bacterium]HIQ06801.1 tryptophan synthase subunit alpha [Anaerolineae bacterium]
MLVGVERIVAAFAQAQANGHAAFMPYLTIGHPAPELTLELVPALEAVGADMFELGVPFSDPLADGPTIQAATQIALRNGITVARCMEIAANLRRQGVQAPFLFMGYYNPILAYGIEAYCRDAAKAGVDGFIVPDLPPEEADKLAAACEHRGLALIYLLAPTSTEERIQLVASKAQGLIYLVSVTGITGARDTLPPHLGAFVNRVRQHTSLPLAVGFGISTPKQAQQVAEIADGVVVGSALVKLAGGPNPVQAVSQLGRALVAGIRHSRP